jgi:hypothetical protein
MAEARYDISQEADNATLLDLSQTVHRIIEEGFSFKNRGNSGGMSKKVKR